MSDTIEASDDKKASGMLRHALEVLKPFLCSSDWTEVAINAPREVWCEGRGGWTIHPVADLSFEYCLRLATLIASFNDKSISAVTPILSAALPGGERVQVVIPPACTPQTVSITVRKPSLIDKTLEQLDTEGAFSAVEVVGDGLHRFEEELVQLQQAGKIREFLTKAVGTRRTVLIVGKTGSGKTTIAKSLLRAVPATDRLITIEDVPELLLHQHPNKVHLFYGRAEEGGTRISAKQALISCLRMKPDRILLAELRGDEAWEFVKSVNTGHPGSISTMHANGALEAFEQLTALIKDSTTGSHLDAGYIKSRLLATIDIVLFYRDRKLAEMYFDPYAKRRHLA